MNRTRRAFPGGFALATLAAIVASLLVCPGGYRSGNSAVSAAVVDRVLSGRDSSHDSNAAFYSHRRPRLLRFELFLTPGPAAEDGATGVTVFNHLV